MRNPRHSEVQGVSGYNSLAVTYFRMGIHTIIGAEAFHCPVRDGKEWDHLAMAAKLDCLPGRGSGEGVARTGELEEVCE